MDKNDFRRAVQLASRPDFSYLDYDDTVLHGIGLPGFQPVTTTIEIVAANLKYHALQFNGQWNSEALNECASYYRHKVTIAN